MSDDIRIKAAAEAMRNKRAELQHLPLAKIYEDLAEAAVTAFFDSLAAATRERWKDHEGVQAVLHRKPR